MREYNRCEPGHEVREYNRCEPGHEVREYNRCEPDHVVREYNRLGSREIGQSRSDTWKLQHVGFIKICLSFDNHDNTDEAQDASTGIYVLCVLFRTICVGYFLTSFFFQS